MTNQEPIGHGRLYWFLHNVRQGAAGFFRRHWRGFGISIFILAALAFGLRGFIHPYIIMPIRQRSFLVLLALLLVAAGVWAKRRRSLPRKLLAFAVVLVGVGVLWQWGGTARDYGSLYYRYTTLSVVELAKLPITSHERLQPLNSIYSLAREKANQEKESPQKPNFVRIGSEYKWTVAVEPAHQLPRLGKVEELIAVDDKLPDFTKRESVNFPVGENMLLGKNSHAATIKTFGLWDFFNYEPAAVKYVKDDAGKWVQVVSLIRWEGWWFPRPAFGGVQLIRQEELDWRGDLWLMLFGAGQRIRPDEITKYRFLVGQNLLPYEVSRYMAQSFRFENGFWGPMPGNHQGDLRIPDLPADVNDQPFTTYFEEVDGRKKGTLYHYFSLQPWDPAKEGLSVSLLVPADGSWPDAYVYRHYLHGDSLTGVSAVASKVRNSELKIDWTTHGPVEHRPFIRDINGQRRFSWLTSVVTYKEELKQGKDTEHTSFIAGSAGANIVITDATTNIPTWVSSDPERWVDEVRVELAKHGHK